MDERGQVSLVGIDGWSAGPDVFALQTRGLCSSVDGRMVLDGVDLRIPEGLICSVVGAAGAGKSHLVKHLVGMLEPDAGDVLVRGRSIGDMSRSERMAIRRDIGVALQDGALFSAMTVHENVALPLRQHTDMTYDEICDAVQDQLESVALDEAADRYPAELSPAMRSRAALARSLVLEPGLVLCDEPDAGLDPVRSALMGELLMQRHAELGGTMVITTTSPDLAEQVSDYVAILWGGKIAAAGPTDEMWGSDDPFVRTFLAHA